MDPAQKQALSSMEGTLFLLDHRFHQRNSHTIDGRWDAVLFAQSDDYAVSCVNLYRSASLSIGQHGVDRIGRGGALGRQNYFSHIFFQVCSFSTRHSGALTDDLERHISKSLSVHNSSWLHCERREHARCVEA
jgi:hypothetical protein